MGWYLQPSPPPPHTHTQEHGLGVAQDEPRAAQMYAAAAQRGCPTAANNLAKMILDGRGGIMQVPAAAATGGRSRRRMGADGVAAPAPAAPTPVSMAMALFRRAAEAGSASAWYNLGVCHLQQIKQQQASLKKLGLAGGGGGGEATPVLLGAKDEAGMAEAIRCLAEAASRGHARAALRAGHLHLLRSAAAAAVDAFATAALNAAAAMAGAAGGGGSHGGAAGEEAASPAAADAAEVEAEALWCLAQLAERQSAVLEGRAAAALAAAAAGSAAGSEGTGGGRPSGDGGAAASRMNSVRSRGLAASASGNSRASGGARASGASGDGDFAGGGFDAGVGAMGDDDVAVGQLLATLAGTSAGGDAAAAAAAAAAIAGGDGISEDMAAAAAADPAAAAALRFAKELCRLDFDCCRQPGAVRRGGALTTAAVTAAGLDPSGVPPAQRVRGLRRLRRQAREVIAESAAPGVKAAADSGGDGESRSSVDGGGGSGGFAAGLPSAGPVSSALARLDLQLQQPGERATRSRCAAAELMAAAAARGHAGAQHWLAGWQWSMGHTGGAAALWQAAAARGHGPSLMVLGQMAEAGHVMVAAAGASAGGAAGQLQTAGRGADLAAAARYYL